MPTEPNFDTSDEGERLFYTEISIPNSCTQDNYNKVAEILEACKKTRDWERKFAPVFNFDVSMQNGTILIKAGARLPVRELKRKMPTIPPAVLGALKDVEQGIELDLKLGTSIADIMKSEKPAMESVLEGFKMKASVTYLKKLRRVLEKAEIEKVN